MNLEIPWQHSFRKNAINKKANTDCFSVIDCVFDSMRKTVSLLIEHLKHSGRFRNVK